jgi:leucyl/phenylalanyl-tRNA---protein transferase
MFGLPWWSDSWLNPKRADQWGQVAVGRKLTPQRVLTAYRRGIFPWYNEDEPVRWWSPDPRAIFELDGLHIARRLRRTIRSGRFTCTVNRAFKAVIRGCADRPGEGTWITADMIQVYETLHDLGHAHSVEAWLDGELAGGIYGVAVGGLFAGESMFSRRRDGSKVALAFLMERLRQRDFQLFDIQFLTDHTAGLGAIEIPRKEYLARLRRAVAAPVTFA